MLADIGISIGLVSIGGRVWQDNRFSELVGHRTETSRRLGATALTVTPLLYLMLVKSFRFYATILITAILVGYAFSCRSVLDVVPRLRSDIVRSAIDLTGRLHAWQSWSAFPSFSLMPASLP